MSLSQADENHRAWMREALRSAAAEFELTPTGRPVFGWLDRSVGTRARSRYGQRWLRVVAEQASWADGDFWTGNADSSVIAGVAKPEVLGVREWQDGPEVLRAEVVTVLPGEACSPTAELRADIDLGLGWWSELRRSVDALSSVETQRVSVDQEQVRRRLRIFFADRVDPEVTRWETAHSDLHWANLMRPEFGILDWELWGLAPAGYDAATLYCYSLLAPVTAAKVRETFADILDTPDGSRAQLYAIARLLLRADHGDHPDLVLPLHRLAGELSARSVERFRPVR